LNSTQLQPVINDGNNYIWDFVDNLPGEYLYFIQATGGGTNAPCSFRLIAESTYDMWVGASEGLLQDMGLPGFVDGRLISLGCLQKCKSMHGIGIY
jgi:hypothetical protein